MKPEHHTGLPKQMDDELPMGKLLKVAAAALFVGLLGVLWAWGEWRYVARQSEPQPREAQELLPQTIGAAEQGIVFQRPFDQLRTTSELDRVAKERLESYGWADRSRGLVHVPIGEAMDELVRRNNP